MIGVSALTLPGRPATVLKEACVCDKFYRKTNTTGVSFSYYSEGY